MSGQALSLYEINTLIKEVLEYSFNETYWIKAEIARINENYSGHCYLELVEKAEFADQVIAQGRGIIWNNIYRQLKKYFFLNTGKELSPGMKILFKARIEYHVVYGLSFYILDIDPSYTIGDMLLQKKQVIEKLKYEGVFDMNKELPFPIVPQRIAVISSETAAGYGDFIAHLKENPYNYIFYTTLFPSVMQGEKAEPSIVAALENIFKKLNHFDVVVIIRGGGGQVDLSCFDSYILANHVAQFPIPVLTGIGHDQDDSVVDMVAHTRLKTPTAVADFIIEKVKDYETTIDQLSQIAISRTYEIISSQSNYLESLYTRLPLIINNVYSQNMNYLKEIVQRTIKSKNYYLNAENQKIIYLLNYLKIRIEQFIQTKEKGLEYIKQDLTKAMESFLQHHMQKLAMYEQVAQLSDPANILKKGFSITLVNDTVLHDSKHVKEGEEMVTILYKGKVKSIVKNKIL